MIIPALFARSLLAIIMTALMMITAATLSGTAVMTKLKKFIKIIILNILRVLKNFCTEKQEVFKAIERKLIKL